jgi:mRNA interferase YafQ
MRRIVQRRQFRNDLKRQKRRGKDIEELLAVVELLAETGTLPAEYRPHALSGEWKTVWECHIEPDWLLIYEVTSKEVLLFRTGTHSDLFE